MISHIVVVSVFKAIAHICIGALFVLLIIVSAFGFPIRKPDDRRRRGDKA